MTPSPVLIRCTGATSFALLTHRSGAGRRRRSDLATLSTPSQASIADPRSDLLRELTRILLSLGMGQRYVRASGRSTHFDSMRTCTSTRSEALLRRVRSCQRPGALHERELVRATAKPEDLVIGGDDSIREVHRIESDRVTLRGMCVVETR